MENSRKIRVAILNHFSSKQIRSKLDLFRCRLYKYPDFARWNTDIIDGLKHCSDIELHIITPHRGLRHKTQVFEDDGVHYYFYRCELPIPLNRIEHVICPQSIKKYPRNRKYAKRFLEIIKPDIAVLIGAENAYYSITALDIDEIPLLIQLQTVYANPERKKNVGQIDKVRWDVEIQLFKKTLYMACTGRMYYDLVKSYNPEAIIFPRCWPKHPYPQIPEITKKYDFVYFARFLNRNKGFDNAVEAMASFVKKYPNARMLAIGERDKDWPQFEKRIIESGLANNLEIHPPFQEYVDLLSHVKQARFALLPITMDVISGTIFEAMSMGMPVVTCRTSGTPSLNEKRETVLISDIGDTESLCQNMIRLYENPLLQERLINNERIFLQEKNEQNEHNANIMVEQFKAVIEHYHHGIPIPKEFLFNTEENIDYRKQ